MSLFYPIYPEYAFFRRTKYYQMWKIKGLYDLLILSTSMLAIIAFRITFDPIFA